MGEIPNPVEESTEAPIRAADPAAAPIVAGPPDRPWLKAIGAVGLGLVVLVGILAVGGFFTPSDAGRPPAEILGMAPDAVATAPGVRFRLSMESEEPGGIQGQNVSGLIDLQAGRFAGDADSGRAALMLLFGGPQRGSLVLTDGLFIRSDGGPWEAVPVEDAARLRPFLDPAKLAQALQRSIDLARIDPTVRATECAIGSCLVVGLELPPMITTDLTALMIGEPGQPPPNDLRPIAAELWLDPETGFPVRLAVRIVAGAATTNLVLDLERLDPPPPIVAPDL
jgi:hypothetical protein